MSWKILILLTVLCNGCAIRIPRPDAVYVVPTTKWGTLDKKSARRSFILDFLEDQDFSEIDGGLLVARYNF